MKTVDQKHTVIQLIFLIASTVLVGKLAQVQLFDSSIKERAAQTALQKRTLYPSRGLIYDRNDKLLVVNEPIYDINVVYKELDPNMDTTLFCQLLEIDKETFLHNIEKDWTSVRFRKSLPFPFIERISSEVFAVFQEHLHQFPGFYPVSRSARTYPHQNGAHVLGYISEVNQYRIDQSNGEYKPGDYIGISGLEKQYEDELKGKKGVEYILKDNLGRSVGKLADGSLDSSAVSGFDITTCLDLDLQAYGEKLFQNKRGSIVAIEPSTGEILTMISAPNYDPNVLSINRKKGKAFSDLLNDTTKLNTFLDRSVMAKYPPGSIFKPILALIAMQEGIIHPNRAIQCSGSYVLSRKSGESQGCHDHPTPYNVQTAIQHSCNSYFYQTMRELLEINGYSKPSEGLEILNHYLDQFGIGRKLGVDQQHEHSGLNPKPALYNELYKDVPSGWRSTYVLSLGIGQGELELTTVQMANLAAILSNRGYYYTPHLIKKFRGSESNIPQRFLTKNKIDINQEYYEPIIEGMSRVVKSGTAFWSTIPGIEYCGKTGTSQNYGGKDHSVFFAFAPRENPKIALAVYVENAGWGGTIAAPISSLIIEKYLNDTIAQSRLWVEEKMIEKNLIAQN